MTDPIQSNFVDECEKAFQFLKNEYGFSGPEISFAPNLLTATYFKGEIAIECIFDQRDDDISIKIVHLNKTKKPNVYRKDEQGKIVRDYLMQLLMKRGVRDFKFPKSIPDQSEHQRIMEGHVRLLRLYATDVLSGSARIFEEDN